MPMTEGNHQKLEEVFHWYERMPKAFPLEMAIRFKAKFRAGCMAQIAEHLSIKGKVLSSNPSNAKKQ
jgi:hypothetical protein